MTPVHGADGTATSSGASSRAVLNQRERINGWSWPPHPLQFVAWFFLIFFSVFYFGVIVFYLPKQWQAAGFIIPGGFYGIHIIYHILALTTDPADPNIRGGTKKGKALFDRSKHRHVIVNSHCYICQTDVGSKSKHCSICNKCVSDFDHHCKWLNNCVGGQNYRLFIGCISSALVLAVLVFTVTIYVFVMYFTNKGDLKSLSGGEFKLFAAVPTDKIFISFIGVMAGLLLLTIALLGHLLGFHIYLMYHKMSTYDFIISSRDRRTESSDVEAGPKSPASRKWFKNKVKPGEGGEENSEPERVEISDNERRSEDSLPNETTVKFINEVSSKVAAKQSKSNVEEELQGSTPKTTPNASHYASQRTIECHDTSEESLKEITSPPTSPRVIIQQPDSVNMAFMPQDNSGNSSGPYGDDTSLSQGRSARLPKVTFQGQGEKLLSSLRRNKERNVPTSDVTETLNNGDCELNAVNAKDIAHQGQDSIHAAPPRRKKKKRRAKAPSDLPPVIVRRPLPQLKPSEDNF